MGIFGCEMLEQRGMIFNEYYCRFSRERLSKDTAAEICLTERHKNCEDYKKKHKIFPW